MNEAYSRVIIDKKLREAGWDIEDPAQVIFEDHGDAGRADYVLKDSSGHAIALIEAKRPDVDPYSAKKQAFDYIQAQYPKVRFIYLANDKLVYLWDLDGGGDAQIVPAFFSREDLVRRQSSRAMNLAKKFSEEKVTEGYFSDVADNVTLRPYQLAAWESIAENYDKGKHAFLLEMATGTGKTVLASLIISRFLRTNNAQNVLFLVDRKSLAIQTKNTFEKLLRGVSAVGTYWGSNRKNLTGANVVVATIQSLMLHGTRDFSPGYFDLIIHDEAHRSIYSPEARAAVDHFVGATKIGLTATPRDFLKNISVEKLSEKDPRKLERRVQRDTYRYFGCDDGVATYRYTIQDGVAEKFLIPPKYHKMNTSVTQQALSEEGITELSDVELEEGESIKIRDLEKKVHFPVRNRRMMEEFLEHALRTPDGEIGKTLVFAVSQDHALALEKILNELKPEYGGRFAMTITSRVQGAHDIAKDFARDTNKLPRIGVTVDMLATGFDCPEILNILFARPIFDPITYQQIKGRGTRLCPAIGKKEFVVFDFCGVVAYFDEKYDWEAPARLAREGGFATGLANGAIEGGSSNVSENEGISEPRVSQTPDVVLTRDVMTLPEGDTVDRNMYRDEWTKAVQSFMSNKTKMVSGALEDPEKVEELIEEINTTLLNKPRLYFNEENLQESHRIVAGIREFFLSAIGRQSLPTRDEQLASFKEALINKFAKTDNPESSFKRAVMVEFIADQAISNDKFRTTVQANPTLDFLRWDEFAQAYSVTEWLDVFSKEELTELVSDISNAKILTL
ncbi:MAG: box helicase [Candidatus Taylorbacteria bacterium]|nr:box helicase [Candidatus Taylorbacteria bacterium]